METNVKSPNPEIRARLQPIRDALLHLHKTLVDSERVNYEKTMGKIPSSNQFLKLLIEDPWFAWLHPLSQLIVSMDEVLDEKEPLTAAVADALVKQAGDLLVTSENGDGFSTHYFEALQNDPDVIFAHATAAKLLNPKKSSA
ncbi:MAG TPA: hypothetical protein VHG71_07420 [Verrucomicrobiae bacterium]|nr:hypothetical protein [Verrucomicrobiae bacterium]